jgi:cation transport ATPase
MLTGDNARSAVAIGSILGLETRAELLPDAKLDAIATYKSKQPIAMVSDGINDAPALAASPVDIAMGGGTDVALDRGRITPEGPCHRCRRTGRPVARDPRRAGPALR